jgi:hypothetical protein
MADGRWHMAYGIMVFLKTQSNIRTYRYHVWALSQCQFQSGLVLLAYSAHFQSLESPSPIICQYSHSSFRPIRHFGRAISCHPTWGNRPPAQAASREYKWKIQTFGKLLEDARKHTISTCHVRNLSLALEPPAFETHPLHLSLSSYPSPFFHHASRRFYLDSRSFLFQPILVLLSLHPASAFFYPGCSPSSGILSIFDRAMMLESAQFKKRVCLRSRMMITSPISIIDRPILDPPDRRVTNPIRDSPFMIHEGRSCCLGDSNVSSAQDTCFALGL